MIGKFATANALTLLVVTILFGAPSFTQTTPAAQTPAAAPTTTQQPAGQPPAGGQEPADEESSSRRKAKPRDFKNWTINVGGGANLDSGATRTYVRGGGGVGTVGASRNANKYLGLHADFIFANLPLRDSAQALAQASGANSHVFAFTLDPIINVPVNKLYGGYVLFGPAYYHRSGSLNSDTAVPGSACNGFWQWWGACSNFSIPLSGSFVNSSLNQFGYNVGGGVTRKMPSGVEIYAEYRLMHGTHSGITTDVRPITIGVRW